VRPGNGQLVFVVAVRKGTASQEGNGEDVGEHDC
jgi:hypothetical protein